MREQFPSVVVGYGEREAVACIRLQEPRIIGAARDAVADHEGQGPLPRLCGDGFGHAFQRFAEGNRRDGSRFGPDGIALWPQLEGFLQQGIFERASWEESLQGLERIFPTV